MRERSNVWVGMDVHKKEIVVAILVGASGELKETRFGNDEKSVRRFARKLKREYGEGVSCVYEAGPCGYAVQRQMASEGVVATVIAPSLIPRKPGERIKTDRRDACKLAELHGSGLLTEVRAPSVEQESARDLCRCRMAAKKDQTRARHRLTKWLLRRGLVYRAGGNWTVKHLTWLRGMKLSNEIDQLVFEDYLGEIERLDERVRRLDSHIEALSTQDVWREAVGRLRCFRGFDTVSAMVVATEIFDFSRFREPRQLMAFLGLVPGVDASGERRTGLPLTKTGNSHVRRILIQAAWNYRHRPGVGHALRKRREGQRDRVIAIADRAQSRLHRRYHYLVNGRRMLSTKAVVAVARELTGFLWSALLDPEPAEQNQGLKA